MIPRFMVFGALTMSLLACGKDDSSATGDKVPDTTQLASATAPTASDARAAIFVQKGCPQCHSISAFGIKSETEVGPDLTLAYEDVQTRFGMKLEDFLHNPTGTMQIVLSSQIQLSPEERDSIIHILKGLHEEREEGEGKDHD